MCLLRIFGRRNELTMKTCSIFFHFSLSQLYNNRQRLFFIWTFSMLTKQFIPFKITLLFPFRHVFSHIIYGKMICKILIQMQTHKIRRCTRNKTEQREEKNKIWISLFLYVAGFSPVPFVSLSFWFSQFNISLRMTICVCVCMFDKFFVCLFALIRVWNYLWKCDEMCTAQKKFQSHSKPSSRSISRLERKVYVNSRGKKERKKKNFTWP